MLGKAAAVGISDVICLMSMARQRYPWGWREKVCATGTVFGREWEEGEVARFGVFADDWGSTGRLLTILRAFPPGEPTKKKFVGEMMAWSCKFGDYPNGNPELHHVAGTLFAEGTR